MALIAKVVGGHFIDATISTNRKGELALQLCGPAALSGGAIFKKRPTLTPDTVRAWQEIIPEARSGATAAFSNVGKAVARAALPGRAGKAAAAAVGSAVDSVMGSLHTVRVEWVDGNESLIRLPEKLFQHLAMLLKHRQLETVALPVPEPEPESPGVIEQLTRLARAASAGQTGVTEQIARLAELRDQGVLTEDEFATKKAELLGRI
jgi:hypothetical protein